MLTAALRGAFRFEIGSLGSTLLKWWLAELRGLVPQSVWRIIAPAAIELILELGPVVILRRAVDGREQILDTAHPEDAAGLEALLARYRVSGRACRTVVRLPERQVLRSGLDLPLTRIRDVPALLFFELGRQTPFAAADAAYDFRIVSRDVDRNRMTCEVAIARREVVEQAVAAVASWGGEVVAVRACPDAYSGWTPMLYVSPAIAREQRRARNLLFGLAFITILLAALCVMVHSARIASLDAALDAELKAARAAATSAQQARSRADSLLAQRRFLPELRRTRSVAAVFDRLAALLPDDTWLTALDMDGDRIRIVGVSSAADRLIGILDGAGEFTDARFEAPIIREPNGNTDRFTIVLKRRRQ